MNIVNFANKYILYLKNRHNKRDNNIWVFGEWFGKRTGDNSTYLANYVVRRDSSLEVYWVCNDHCDVSELDSRIHVIRFSSPELIQIERKAGAVFMGEGIADLNAEIINYVGNALKVNLWHGFMWKKIGDDAKKTVRYTLADKLRMQMYAYDAFVAPSEEYKTHILTGFRAGNKEFIPAGLPRNALFYQKEEIVKCREKICRRLGSPKKYIICYLPTFRDTAADHFSLTDILNEDFNEWLRLHDAVIIQKAHFAEKKKLTENSKQLVSLNDVAAQELMAASDMLITDYSSCFFDYLILDRPIIHHLYDYEFYKNKDRGLYYEKEEVVCGSVTSTNEELIREIKDQYDHPQKYAKLRRERLSHFMTYESKDNCEVIYSYVKNKLK